jgi:hypothetical protein
MVKLRMHNHIENFEYHTVDIMVGFDFVILKPLQPDFLSPHMLISIASITFI